MNLNNRIDEILKHYNLEAVDLSKKVDIPGSTISKTMSGASLPNYRFLNKILIHFKNVNARWLITGEGSMFSGEERIVVPQEEIESKSATKGEELFKQLYEMERQRTSQLEREIGRLTNMLDNKTTDNTQNEG